MNLKFVDDLSFIVNILSVILMMIIQNLAFVARRVMPV